MSATRLKMHGLLIGCLAVGLGLSIPASASAGTQSFWSHGHTARVQFPENTTELRPYSVGLGFEQNSGMLNWVQIGIPTMTDVDGSPMSARLIKIRFYTGAEVRVTQIDVYNGETYVRALAGPAPVAGWQTLELDLGSPVNFDRGMGLSIRVGAGVEQGNRWFILSGAGATFETAP